MQKISPTKETKALIFRKSAAIKLTRIITFWALSALMAYTSYTMDQIGINILVPCISVIIYKVAFNTSWGQAFGKAFLIFILGSAIYYFVFLQHHLIRLLGNLGY